MGAQPPAPGSHSHDAEFAHVDNRINLTRFFSLVVRLFSDVLGAMPKNNSKERLSWVTLLFFTLPRLLMVHNELVLVGFILFCQWSSLYI